MRNVVLYCLTTVAALTCALLVREVRVRRALQRFVAVLLAKRSGRGK